MSNALRILVFESPSDSPNYNRDMIDVRAAKLTTAIIVKRGTQRGKPTVDFQFIDQDGADHVALSPAFVCNSFSRVRCTDSLRAEAAWSSERRHNDGVRSRE